MRGEEGGRNSAARSYLLWVCSGSLLGQFAASALAYAFGLKSVRQVVILVVILGGGAALGAHAGSLQFGKRYRVSRAFHARSILLSVVGVVIQLWLFAVTWKGPMSALASYAVWLLTMIAVLLPILSVHFIFSVWWPVSGRQPCGQAGATLEFLKGNRTSLLSAIGALVPAVFHVVVIGIPLVTGAGGEGLGYGLLILDYPLFLIGNAVFPSLFYTSSRFGIFWFGILGTLMYGCCGFLIVRVLLFLGRKITRHSGRNEHPHNTQETK